jgi:Mg-chelatase subunit ChlD
MRVASILVMMALLSGVAYADGALVVLVDRAMTSDKIATVTHALTESLNKFDHHDQIAVVSYGKTARVELPLQSVSNRDRLSSAVAKITTAGASDLSAGLLKAGELLSRTTRDKYVLVVTDSETVTGYQPELRTLAKQNVRISALGYQANNRSKLEALVGNGGRTHSISRGQDLARAFASSGTVRRDSLAIVFAIDRSYSMQGAKLEMAKEAARAGVDVLDTDTYVAVVAYDSDASVLVRPQQASNRMRISTEIARLTAGGGSNTYTGLKEAYELLKDINATQKHVVLLSDGDARTDGVPDVLQDMRAANITVSAVGVQGADRDMLMMIADRGSGRLYMVEDIGAIPRIFVREASP